MIRFNLLRLQFAFFKNRYKPYWWLFVWWHRWQRGNGQQDGRLEANGGKCLLSSTYRLMSSTLAWDKPSKRRAAYPALSWGNSAPPKFLRTTSNDPKLLTQAKSSQKHQQIIRHQTDSTGTDCFNTSAENPDSKSGRSVFFLVQETVDGNFQLENVAKPFINPGYRKIYCSGMR